MNRYTYILLDVTNGIFLLYYYSEVGNAFSESDDKRFRRRAGVGLFRLKSFLLAFGLLAQHYERTQRNLVGQR